MAIKLTNEQKKGIAAGVIGLVAFSYSYFSFFWLPLARKISSASANIETIESKIDKARRAAARKDHLEIELALLNRQALEAERRLPKDKSVPSILVTLSDLAARSRVQFLSFSPGATTSKQFFSELSYSVTIRGRFHDIGKFFAEISLEERIFNIQNVSYGEAKDGGHMQVQFTLISYQYKG